jgi:NADH dehydrogenase
MVAPDGMALPGVAPVAMQQGRFAARAVRARLRGRPGPRAFRYRDKGRLATIGRGRAIAELGPVRISGPLAWLAWLGIHLTYLTGVQNRTLVLTRWTVGLLTGRRGARLIGAEAPADTGPRAA